MKDKELKQGLIWSFLVHGTLLVLLCMNKLNLPAGNAGVPQTPEQQQAQAEQQAKQERTVEVEIIPPPEKKVDEVPEMTAEEGLLAKAPHAKDECPDSFGGIGITQNVIEDHGRVYIAIAVVHQGYPAERAGLRVGDEMLNSNILRGEVGTPVDVKIIRDGVPLVVSIIRDKICTNKIDQPERRINP